MIIRKAKVQKFTQIDNASIYDASISWKAKGILLHILSRPDNWQFYESEMCNHATDGRDSLRSGIKELEAAGYLVRTRVRGEKGYLKEYEYLVYETPQKVAVYAKESKDGFSNIGFSNIGFSDTSNTDSTKTDSSKTINTPSGASLDSKDKSENPVKESKEESIGLIFKLARQAGLPEPELGEARGAAIVLFDEITPNLGKKAIPALIQGFREARERIDQGEDADYLTVFDVASQIRDGLYEQV